MSLFGELHIEQSRAVSDDEDDELAVPTEEQLLTKKSLHWFTNNFKPSGTINVNQLILAYDPLSTAFINSFLLNHHDSKLLIGAIATDSQFNIELKNSNENLKKSLTNDYVYLLNANSKSYVIVRCYHEIKSAEIHEILKEILSRISFDSAVVFCSEHKSNYYGPLDRIPAVRYISNFNVPQLCERFEEPNFLYGLPAALVNSCMIIKKPVLTLVCVNATLDIDITALKELYKVASTYCTGLFIDDQNTKESIIAFIKMTSALNTLFL